MKDPDAHPIGHILTSTFSIKPNMLNQRIATHCLHMYESMFARSQRRFSVSGIDVFQVNLAQDALSSVALSTCWTFETLPSCTTPNR